MFAYSGDAADPEKEAAQLRFGTQISPHAQEQRVRLQRRLVELGYGRPGLETMIQRFRNQMELFHEDNVPFFAELAALVTRWTTATGAMTVEWTLDKKTPAPLLPSLH